MAEPIPKTIHLSHEHKMDLIKAAVEITNAVAPALSASDVVDVFTKAFDAVHAAHAKAYPRESDKSSEQKPE